MKLMLNDYNLKVLNSIVFSIAISMSISTAFLFCLDSTSTEHPKNDPIAFFETYHLGKLFALPRDGKGGVMKKVVHDVFTPVPHRLTAVYMDGSHSFVAITDNNSKTEFVNKGAIYKNLYRLTAISQERAVFFAYGKEMILRLGEQGHLDLKELVTSYVADENASGTNFTIAHTTLDRYSKNMGETWKNVMINPVINQNKITGFRVDKIAQETPFALLGIMQGDIITGVDNKPLTSYATAFAAYQNLLHRSAIKITILRNNQPKDLEYEISR